MPRALAATLGIVLTVGVSAAVMTSQPALAGVTAPKALILGDSVSVPGPAPATSTESIEQYEAQKDGFVVTSVTGTQWDKMTAAQFRQYQVIIIGDPDCNGSEGGASFAAAVKNESTWEPVVMNSGGNKVLIGTDPTFHYGEGHAEGAVLEANGIAFAGKVSGATGAYVDLSCAYDSSDPKTAVPLLDGLSSHGKAQFTIIGEGKIGACATGVNIVAKTGPTTGLTDAGLSDWECSVHEAFDKFPSDYTPLVLAPVSSKFPQSYCADDVETKALVCGAPYIMVSGSGVVVKSEISLAPATQTVALGSTAKLVATVKTVKGPVSGGNVVFSVDGGPDVGKTFTGKTSAAGMVAFTYTNKGALGTDSVSATYTAAGGLSEKATASVTWKKAAVTVPRIDTVSSAFAETKVVDKVSTTAAGDLLVAFVAGDAPPKAKGTQRAVISGGGLTWRLVGRENAPLADTEVWAARAAGKLTNVKVTVSGQLKGFDEAVTIVAYKGAHGAGPAATKHSAGGALTATLKTATANSWVFAVGADWAAATLRVAGPGQFTLHQVTDHDADKEMFWVQARLALTPKAGTTVTINDTKPAKDPFNLVLVAIF
jgi:hypothetical protein